MLFADGDDDEEEEEEGEEEPSEDVEEAVPELIFGIEKPVLIRLAMMSALTLALNLLLPKPSQVAERQIKKQQEALEKQQALQNQTAVVEQPEEPVVEDAGVVGAPDDDGIEVFEEGDDDLVMT